MKLITVVLESVIFTAKFIYASFRCLIIVVPKGFDVVGHESIVITL